MQQQTLNETFDVRCLAIRSRHLLVYRAEPPYLKACSARTFEPDTVLAGIRGEGTGYQGNDFCAETAGKGSVFCVVAGSTAQACVRSVGGRRRIALLCQLLNAARRR